MHTLKSKMVTPLFSSFLFFPLWFSEVMKTGLSTIVYSDGKNAKKSSAKKIGLFSLFQSFSLDGNTCISNGDYTQIK